MTGLLLRRRDDLAHLRRERVERERRHGRYCSLGAGEERDKRQECEKWGTHYLRRRRRPGGLQRSNEKLKRNPPCIIRSGYEPLAARPVISPHETGLRRQLGSRPCRINDNAVFRRQQGVQLKPR